MMLKNFKPVTAMSDNQEKYIKSIYKNIVTICTGLAGTGKTYVALNVALELMKRYEKTYKRIVIIRPYIPSNTGEKLGALPGDLNEKVGPFVESIKDNLRGMLEQNQIEPFIRTYMDFSILSMCRGRSFNNCIVIVEEAQNVPIDGDAMKMLLTRIGNDSKMIIAGDLDQCDIPKKRSGLFDAISILNGIKGIGIVEMDDPVDIQRSPIVRNILNRYNERDRSRDEWEREL